MRRRLVRGLPGVLLLLGPAGLPLACGGGDGGGGDGDMTEPQFGAVSGTVTDTAGAGMPSVSVSLAATGKSTRTTTTASSGSFSFSSVDVGSWTLSITLPTGFVLASGETGTRTVQVTANQTTTVQTLRLQPAPPTTGGISGSVTSSGAGVAGATITLTPGGQTSTTNSAGAYSFTGLTVGNYTVTITPPSGFTLSSTEQAAKSATVTAGQTTTVSWTLQPVTGTTVNISVGDNFFSPAVDTVVVGTTVKWTNNGNVAHTTTSDASTPVWDGNLSTGGSFQFTFTQAGSFPYHCEIHSCKASQGCSSMNGTIVVQ